LGVRAGLIVVALVWGHAAWAEDLSRNTSCADFLWGRAHPPPTQEMLAQSDELVGILVPYFPPGIKRTDGETLIWSMAAAAASWCGTHGQGTLGAAVDAAAGQAHLVLHPEVPGQKPFLLINMAPLPATDTPDAATEAAVGVFRRDCLAFESAAALRAWAAQAGLRALPVVSVLSPGAGARAYDLSTPGGAMVLISADNGACQVVVQHGVVTRFEAAMEHEDWAPDLTLRIRQDVIDPVHGIRQRVYDAEGRDWGRDVLLAGKPSVPPQAGDKLITLLAAPRRAGV
jgi:hypothetical protein